MTHDIDSRLEAALQRIAVAHVPDDAHRHLARADEVVADIDGAHPAVASRAGQPNPAKHRVLLGTAVGALVVAGIGALFVLAPSDDNDAAPSQSAAAPAQSASPPEAVPPADVPLVTLGITNPSVGTDAWSRLADNELAGRSEHLVVATDGGVFVWGGYGSGRALTDRGVLRLGDRAMAYGATRATGARPRRRDRRLDRHRGRRDQRGPRQRQVRGIQSRNVHLADVVRPARRQRRQRVQSGPPHR